MLDYCSISDFYDDDDATDFEEYKDRNICDLDLIINQ